MDEKRGIGKNNALLFKISQDLKRFKEITTGHPVIMGRKTYESIGRLLPNRTNIIITRDSNYVIYEAVMAHSLDEAMDIAKKAEQQRLSLRGAEGDVAISREDRHARSSLAMTDEEEVFIIGGGQIFAQAISMAEKLYLTIVKGTYKADTFFPDYAAFTNVVAQEEGESEGYTYTFLELTK